MMVRLFGTSGALLGLLSVALGAFAAHGLRGRLDAAALETFQTAVRYQLAHALALIATAGCAAAGAGGAARWAGGLFLAGVVLFSGSLYVLALGGPRWLGPVTPFGGLAFMGGWLALAVALWRLGARVG
jgi:uncharacterized membrane protein YgdD (TMEM256/DUF423 family)